MKPDSGIWTCVSSLVTVESPWVRMLAERWIDQHGTQLDYWRVERAHSLIIIPIWREQILLPKPQFRPGVQRLTLDLPGGRMPPNMQAQEVARLLLEKELGLAKMAITGFEELDSQGWIINSSFSNQLLFGLVAQIDPDVVLDLHDVHRRIPATIAAVRELIHELECLQCRSVLQTWLLSRV